MMKMIAAVMLSAGAVGPADAQSNGTPASHRVSAVMTPEAARAQAILIQLIQEARSGQVDHDSFEVDIVPMIRSSQPQVTRRLRDIGDVVEVTYDGPIALGFVRAHRFHVQHARGRSTWRLSLGRRGRISNIDYRVN